MTFALVYAHLNELDGFAWDWGQSHAGERVETDRLVGFCLLFKREVLNKIGKLDERFGIGNFEDDDARAALVEILAEALKAESESADKPGASSKATELLQRVNWLRIAKHSATAAASLYFGVPFGLLGRVFKAGKGTLDGVDEEEAGEIEETAEGVGAEAPGLLRSKVEKSPPKEIQGIRDCFAEALTELGITLVVLIDDLDRCLPETTISTLEAIRLFLFLDNTAFVIATKRLPMRRSVHGNRVNRHKMHTDRLLK